VGKSKLLDRVLRLGLPGFAEETSKRVTTPNQPRRTLGEASCQVGELILKHCQPGRKVSTGKKEKRNSPGYKTAVGGLMGVYVLQWLLRTLVQDEVLRREGRMASGSGKKTVYTWRGVVSRSLRGVHVGKRSLDGTWQGKAEKKAKLNGKLFLGQGRTFPNEKRYITWDTGGRAVMRPEERPTATQKKTRGVSS